jgi:hypothetical protein
MPSRLHLRLDRLQRTRARVEAAREQFVREASYLRGHGMLLARPFEHFSPFFTPNVLCCETVCHIKVRTVQNLNHSPELRAGQLPDDANDARQPGREEQRAIGDLERHRRVESGEFMFDLVAEATDDCAAASIFVFMDSSPYACPASWGCFAPKKQTAACLRLSSLRIRLRTTLSFSTIPHVTDSRAWQSKKLKELMISMGGAMTIL